MNELKDRLIEARLEAGLSQEELAKLAGLKNQSNVGNIENGHRKSTSYVVQLAHALNVEPLWLATGKGPKRRHDDQSNAIDLQKNKLEIQESCDYSTIPHFAITASLGTGIDLIDTEDVIEKMTLKNEWLSKNVFASKIKNLAVISGKGNSMSPTINDGDLVLVDCGVRSANVDGIYVLSANNRIFIKTVRQRIDGVFEISSDNPSVKTVDVLNGDYEVIIYGRVVWVWNGKKL